MEFRLLMILKPVRFVFVLTAALVLMQSRSHPKRLPAYPVQTVTHVGDEILHDVTVKTS